MKLNTQKNSLLKSNEVESVVGDGKGGTNDANITDKKQGVYQVIFGDNRDESVAYEAPICLTYLK